jgi:hypothetical protein
VQFTALLSRERLKQEIRTHVTRSDRNNGLGDWTRKNRNDRTRQHLHGDETQRSIEAARQDEESTPSEANQPSRL